MGTRCVGQSSGQDAFSRDAHDSREREQGYAPLTGGLEQGLCLLRAGLGFGVGLARGKLRSLKYQGPMDLPVVPETAVGQKRFVNPLR